MFGDRERPERVRAEQERALLKYLRREVYPYSDFYRRQLEAGIGSGRLSSLDDLARLPFIRLSAVRDPGSLVLRPDATRIRRFGHWSLRARLRSASIGGRQEQLGRNHIDPLYKPVHWTLADGIPLAASAADLERLAEIGRRWLEALGIVPSDVLVSILPAGPTIAFWQLALGARRAGLSALHLSTTPTLAELDALTPNVLVGRTDDLARVLVAAVGEGRELPTIHTVVAIGEPPDPAGRLLLESLIPAAIVRWAWAPPGLRSLWAECKGGGGLHTSPAAEWLEVVHPRAGSPASDGDHGEIVWSALGWKGSVLLRLRTGVLGAIAREACPGCGRTTPRIVPPAFAAALDALPEIACWQAELRTVDGSEELVVALALHDGARDRDRIFRALDRDVNATQFVLLSRSRMERRLEQAPRVLDLRS